MSLGTDLDSVESKTPLTKPKGYPETLINNTRIASYCWNIMYLVHEVIHQDQRLR